MFIVRLFLIISCRFLVKFTLLAVTRVLHQSKNTMLQPRNVLNETAVWRQLLLPINDNYFSPSTTTTTLTNF